MSVNGLAALVGWGMILWRLPRVQLRSTQARYPFATLVCFTLAATFSTPFVASRLDLGAQLPGLSLVAEYAFAVAAASFWALSCLSLDGSLSKRSWLIWLAPLVFFGLLIIWWMFRHDMSADRTVSTNGELLVTTVAQGYAFAIVAAIALPALGRQAKNEQSVPIRLRMLMILATQVILAVWLGARVLLGPMVLLGILPRTYSFSFVNVLIGLMILAYTASLLPPSAFVRFARWTMRWQDWTSLMRLRRIERQTATLVGARPLQIPLAEAVFTPDYALYRVLIALLDRRKALRSSSNQVAQRHALWLDKLVALSSSYLDLVRDMQLTALQ